MVGARRRWPGRRVSSVWGVYFGSPSTPSPSTDRATTRKEALSSNCMTDMSLQQWREEQQAQFDVRIVVSERIFELGLDDIQQVKIEEDDRRRDDEYWDEDCRRPFIRLSEVSRVLPSRPSAYQCGPDNAALAEPLRYLGARHRHQSQPVAKKNR